MIQNINKIAKESKQHSVEINRIQTLVEGQLSYVHSLNKRAKKFQQYFLISSGLAVVALILSIVFLLP